MRKHYTPAFKAQVVLEALKEEKSISQIASEHGLHPNVVRKWKEQALAGLPGLFAGEREAGQIDRAAHEREVHELYAEIGRLTTQLTWLRKKSGLGSDSR